MLYLNIQSLLSNIDELRLLINQKKPLLVLLSETHVTENINESEIQVLNYNLLRCDSHSRHTGGCVIYYKSELLVNQKSCETFNKSVWILSIEVNSKEKTHSGTYTILYRSPNSVIPEFLVYFEEWCERNMDLTKTNLICNDFNIDLFKSAYAKKMKITIKELGMKQKVNKPTRVTNSTSTLIDYVLTNDKDIKVTVMNTDKISDHMTILVEKKIKQENPAENHKKLNTISVFKYRKETFEQYLKLIKWEEIKVINDINLKAEQLVKELKNCTKCFYKSVNMKSVDNNKWYTPEIHKKKQELDKQQTKSIYTSDWSKYKSLRNIYTNILKKAKNNEI